MIELIKAIAMLCSLHVGGNSSSMPEYVARVQYSCQQQYAACVLKKGGPDLAQSLLQCVGEK